MAGLQIYSKIHNIHTDFTSSRNQLENSMARLASGDRFVDPGREPGGDLSLSEKYRYRIQTGEQSTQSIQNGMTYLDQADFYAATTVDIIHRMTELASLSLDPITKDNERKGIDAEYQSLINEISQMTRNNTFYEKQTIGRDAVVSFDSIKNQIHFWNANGGDDQNITRQFNSYATDADNNYIGFDSARDFSMSRDGRSLFFLGNDSTGATITLKRYDIKTDLVYSSTETYSATDILFTDEQGSLFANSGGTLYSIDDTNLKRTATAVIDMASNQEFSIYKDRVTYHNTSDQIVRYDLNLASTSVLVANPDTVVSSPPAAAANNFALGGVDHDISASGRYIADEISADTVRVIDTQTNTGTTITVGTGNSVSNIQFNEDGNRIYYINEDTNEIRYLDVGTNSANNVTLNLGGTTVEGKRDISLSGLDLGGTNFGSIIDFTLAEDSYSLLNYEAADLRLYNLGLLDTSVDTLENADTSLAELQTAMNRVSLERAKLGAFGSRFRHILDSHQKYVANMRDAENSIRNTDIAKESTRLSKLKLQNSAAAAMISQFNDVLQNVLLLLNR